MKHSPLFWSAQAEWDLIRCVLDNAEVLARCQTLSPSHFHDPAHAIMWASLQWLDSVGAELTPENLELISGQALPRDHREWVDDTCDSLAAEILRCASARNDDRAAYWKAILESEDPACELLLEVVPIAC